MDKYYNINCVINILNNTQNLLSKNIQPVKSKIGQTICHLEISTFSGFYPFDIIMPDGLLLKNISFEWFCKRNNIDIKVFDSCLFNK